MSTAIKVENLSKQYRLGTIGTGSMAHDVNKWWHRLKGKENPYLKIGEVNDRTVKGNSEYVWALKDLNFKVNQGEVLGIIGRNGAGKSTLLKILSRTTAPTTGTVKLKGRVASLLEVGTGFHPELSGRENIFLNGALLGMTKKEIRGKFDEIIEFSGVERYIDTPVKRYSSGMYVRLAFGVAAHLESEILIVDEVLAVGDLEFQRKCLGKMEDVSKQGRTVLLVSHNVSAILSLCKNSYLIEQGYLKYQGNTESAIKKYLERSSDIKDSDLIRRTDRKGDGSVKLTGIEIRNSSGESVIRCGNFIDVLLTYSLKQKVKNINFIVQIADELNRPILFLDSKMVNGKSLVFPTEGKVVCRFGPLNIVPGSCIVNIAVQADGSLADQVKSVGTIQVEENDFFGTGVNLSRQEGIYLVNHKWHIEKHN